MPNAQTSTTMSQNHTDYLEASSLEDSETNSQSDPFPEGPEATSVPKECPPFGEGSRVSDEGKTSSQPIREAPTESQTRESSGKEARGERSNSTSRNSDLQDVWEREMEGIGTTGRPHKQGAVLMTSWVEDIDDLDTAKEVDALGDVFEKDFRYSVVKKQISAGKKPRQQLTKHLADFILDFDSESNLLIIYYAGHGTSPRPGELVFTGELLPPSKHSDRNSIAWHSIENQLESVSADVLLIFDCCHAGNLAYHLDRQRGHFPTRSFEFLAACKKDKLTNPPGKHSFTSALIWALKELLEKRKRFTTRELQTEIMRAPKFPKEQHVQVFDRGVPCDQQLVLAAVPLATENSTPNSPGTPDVLRLKPKAFFDLRFWYLKSPDEAEITAVASIMKRLIRDEKIGAHRIAWIHSEDVDHLRTITNKWRALTRRRSPTTPSPPLRLGIPLSYGQNSPPSPTPLPRHPQNTTLPLHYAGTSEPFGNPTLAIITPLVNEHQAKSEELDGQSNDSVIKVVFPEKNLATGQETRLGLPANFQLLHSGALLFLFIALYFGAYKYSSFYVDL